MSDEEEPAAPEETLPEDEDAAEAPASEAEGSEGLGAQAIESFAGELAAAFSKDLGSLVGIGAEVEAAGTRSIGSDALAWEGSVVDQAARTGGDEARSLHMVCPAADAAALGALQAGGDVDAAKEARKTGDFAAHAGGFGEVMKLLAALAGSLLERHGLGEVTLEDAREIEDPSGDRSWLGAGSWWSITLGLTLEGFDRTELTLLLEGSGEEAARQEEVPALAFVLIEPDSDERDRMEELGEENDREITALDPQDFGEDSYETIAESGAVVLAWDLGGRSGLELLEHLVREPRTREIPVLVAHDRVTRPMVERVMAAGARGFVLRPYRLEDIDRALGG